MDFNQRPLFIFFQKNQIVSHDVGYVKVYDPVHQVKAYETHREYDARILVYVRRRHAQQFTDVLQTESAFITFVENIPYKTNEVENKKKA